MAALGSQPEGCRTQAGCLWSQPPGANTIKYIYIVGLVQKQQRVVRDIFPPGWEGGCLLLTPPAGSSGSGFQSKPCPFLAGSHWANASPLCTCSAQREK